MQRLQPYRQAIPGRAWFELAVTALPFAVLWLAMWHSLAVGYWLTLLLAVPAAGFLVRLFVIQHDCGHGSFFRSRGANDRLGRVIGVLTLTPYAHWRHQHALHHGSSGNLDRRGEGDVETLTVAEFRARPLVAARALPAVPAPGHHPRARSPVRVRPAAAPARESAPRDRPGTGAT